MNNALNVFRNLEKSTLYQLGLTGITLIALAGCASQQGAAYRSVDMTNFQPDCKLARSQIDYLNGLINEYLIYANKDPKSLTLEDRRYYGKLKNGIWSLRSSCSTKYL